MSSSNERVQAQTALNIKVLISQSGGGSTSRLVIDSTQPLPPLVAEIKVERTRMTRRETNNARFEEAMRKLKLLASSQDDVFEDCQEAASNLTELLRTLPALDTNVLSEHDRNLKGKVPAPRLVPNPIEPLAPWVPVVEIERTRDQRRDAHDRAFEMALSKQKVLQAIQEEDAFFDALGGPMGLSDALRTLPRLNTHILTDHDRKWKGKAPAPRLIKNPTGPLAPWVPVVEIEYTCEQRREAHDRQFEGALRRQRLQKRM